MARPVTPETLVDLLASARREHEGPMLMASDGDGTLWRGDVGEDLFEVALEGSLLRAPAREPLLRDAADHGIAVPQAADANDVGRALLAAHREGRYPNAAAFAMMAWAFAGFTEAELDALCERALDERGFEARIRPELSPMRAWGEEAGVPLWLVSASPLAVARAAGRRMRVPPARVVAMEPLIEDHVIKPRLGALPTYRDGKLARLRERASDLLLGGFGDSYWDLALIESARIGVAVAPNEKLRAHMEKMDHGYVLEAASD